MPDTGRFLPQNVEAEQAVLGSLLLDSVGAIARVAPLLTADDYYREAHRTIYAAALALYERRQPVDFVLLCDELERRGQLERVGGPAYLTSLLNQVPSAVNAEHYAGVVAEAARRRRLISAAGQIATAAYDTDEDAAAAEAKAQAVVLALGGQRAAQGWQSAAALAGGFFHDLTFRGRHRGQVLGVPTGFSALDRLTGGLQPANLIYVAGRPGSGKTSWALNVAAHAALGRRRVAVGVFSLEMAADEIRQRLYCAWAGVDSQRLRSGRLDGAEWRQVGEAVGAFQDAPLHVDATPGLRITELRARARRLQTEQGVGLLVVDYLQLLHESGTKKGQNREQAVAELSGSLKELARELEVPVLCCSQLNRAVENRPGNRPQLADLRDSGSVEQDADVVLFLYREELYDPATPRRGLADLIVAKHRSGPTGTVTVRFEAGATRFRDLDEREPEQPAPRIERNARPEA